MDDADFTIAQAHIELSKRKDWDDVVKSIPTGDYCYTRDKDGKRVVCPFWARVPHWPYQGDGYCAYLGKGDQEITGYFSLLWDMVKECDVNLEEPVE